MELECNPIAAWKEDTHAPLWARGQEDIGGAPGPSTYKDEKLKDRKGNKGNAPVFYSPLHIGPSDALKGASPSLGKGVHGCFYVLFSWKRMKNYVELIKECGLGCTGGGCVPTPMSCQTLGWAMHRKTQCPALMEVGVDVFVLFLVGRV